MRCNKLLCLLLPAFAINTIQGQSMGMNSLDSFSAKLITEIRANAKEQVFLATDRSVFKTGEYVWFNAFLINSVTKKLSSKSRFLFVDLVNDKDTVISRVILNAAGKQLDSRIKLNDSLPTGYYWLRAYTRQMAEKDTNDITVKTLYVLGDIYALPPKKKKNIPDPREVPVINFYPEGNNMITGITSVVGLQATFTNGAPLSVNGYITDDHDTVTRFSTNAYGLGKFEFEPSGYRRYKAVVNWNGKDISYPLPPFNFYGGQLSVVKQNDGYKLRILMGDSIYTKDTPNYLVGISKDSLVFAALGKGQYETFIDGQKLPQGIVSFYLFDKNFKPLSERSVYVKKNDVVINVATNKSIYTERDKTVLTISVTDAEQHTIPSLISVAVSDSIFSHQQPQCDFSNTGFNAYEADKLLFTANSCFTDDDIDLKMLTRYNTYESITNNTSQLADDNDSLLYIKGTVLNEKNSSAANKIISIFANSNADFFTTDTTDNKGRFCFPFDIYPDSTKFVIEVKNADGVDLNNIIRLDTVNYPKLKTPLALKQYLITEPKQIRERFNAYYNWNENGQLPTVTVKDEIKNADYDVSKRVSPNSTIITSKDLDGRITVDNAVLKAGGLQVLNGYLVMHGPSAMRAPGPKDEPLILVEGMQVPLIGGDIGTTSPALSYMRGLDPKDIDFIEILKDGNSANFGLRAGNGVILINLLNKQRDYGTNKNNMNVFYAKGISKPAFFPEPPYNRKNKKGTLPDDKRSTIFWNTNLLTTDTGGSTFSFYTSDVPATYNVTVTGITIRGDVIHKTITFQSKK